MKTEEFNKIIKGMQEKLGKDNASKIADDLGTLISDNSNMNKEIENKNSEIDTLKQDKENLIIANGNLLQQVAITNEDEFEPKKKEKEDEKPFSFKAQFDKNGDFIE